MKRVKHPGSPEVGSHGAAASGNGHCRLDEMRRGEAATIVSLDPTDPDRLRKLVALGVLPGARVHLQQRYPAVVFRLGHTELAVDQGLARVVCVRRDP